MCVSFFAGWQVSKRFNKFSILVGGILLAVSFNGMTAEKAAKKSKPAPHAAAATAVAATAAATTAAAVIPAGIKADLETGQQINGVCAACHGPLGQGGKKGEYPRIAGMSFEYLQEQLLKFKARKRHNMPMFPYTEERELPDGDVVHVAAYVSQLKLDTKPPVFREDEDALVRLQAMDKVFNVPRTEGDVDAGAKVYKTECASCHGAQGQGKKGTPLLAGQYTQYLKRQIGLFTKGERIHDEDLKNPSQDVLNQLKAEEIRDILAYLSTLDD